MILQIGLQILLPAFLVVGLWRGEFRSRPEWLLNFLSVSAALLFVFLTARWDFTSYYLNSLTTGGSGTWRAMFRGKIRRHGLIWKVRSLGS